MILRLLRFETQIPPPQLCAMFPMKFPLSSYGSKQQRSSKARDSLDKVVFMIVRLLSLKTLIPPPLFCAMFPIHLHCQIIVTNTWESRKQRTDQTMLHLWLWDCCYPKQRSRHLHTLHGSLYIFHCQAIVINTSEARKRGIDLTVLYLWLRRCCYLKLWSRR